jgi:tetratricopeptide (TPR) repeat protein
VAGRLAGGAAALALAAAAVLAVPLYLGARLTDRAATTWPVRPSGALADLERARALNPLSPAIALNEGVIAVEVGDRARARAAFTVARERDPSAWYPPLALALLEAREGRRASALRLLQAAAERNPREPTLPRLRQQLGAGRAPGIRTVQREILSRPA